MFARLMYVLAFSTLVIFSAWRAQAAPQVLAVLPSASGVPFHCADGECRAELTTYCLQKDRDTPAYGEAYRPADNASFTLAVTDSKGRKIRLPVSGRVEFAGERGFMAARAVIPEAVVARHDIAAAALIIGKHAALLPEPVENDSKALKPAEIDAATGPLRRAGAQIVDGSVNAAAARFLTRAARRFVQVDEFRPHQLNGQWQSIRNEAGPDLDSPKGLAVASTTYDQCTAEAHTAKTSSAPSVVFASTMLRCLQRNHDSLMRDVNVTFWNSLTGS